MLIQIMFLVIFFMAIGLFTYKARIQELENKLEQYEPEEL